MANFDSFFDKYGHFSAYHVKLILAIFLLCGWLYPSVSINYIGAPMGHWCDLSHIPGNFSLEELKDMFLPRNEKGEFDSCHMYKFSADKPDDNSTNREKVECIIWEYDRSLFRSTIVSKYNLVCDREWLVALAASMMAVGFTLSALLSGFTSDRFGRLRVLMVHLFLQAAGGFGGIFAPNYLLFAISRVILGLGNGATWMCGIVLMAEEVGPPWRSTVAVGANFAYSIGFCLLTGVAYFIRETEYLQLALALPSVLYFSYGLFLVESPRWLLVRKRYERGKSAVKQLFPKKFWPQLDTMDYTSITVVKTETKKASWFSLCRTRRVALGTIIIHYCWVAASLMWYALSLNASTLPGNIFLVTFLMGLMEIPAGLTCMVLCKWRLTGRKLTCLGSLMAAGVCGFACVPLLHYELDHAVTAVSLLGKFFISVAWSSAYAFSAELYPTEVRNSAMGSSAACGWFCGILGSFVGGPMGNVWGPMPYVIYGCLGISASLLGLYLPEPLGKQLCDTVEEAEKYGFVRDKELSMELDVSVALKEKQEIETQDC